LSKEGGNIGSQSLYTMWNHIGTTMGKLGQTSSPFYQSTIGSVQATSVQMSGAFGRGNYNAAIVSLTARQWRGLTINTNFTWSRYPLFVYTDGNISDESLGQGNPSSGSLSTNAVLLSPYNGGSSIHRTPGSNGVGTNGYGLNQFSDPSAVYNQFRPFILGLDG